MNLLRNQKPIIMKKTLFILLLSLLFYPFLRAQNPGDLDIEIKTYQCDSTNNFDAATGCTYWVSNALGDTVFQDVVPSFTQNWACFAPYDSTKAPYFVNFDSICLNSNGVSLDNYSFQVPNIHPVGNMYWSDSVNICENTPSNTIEYSVNIWSCDSTGNDPLINAVGCDYWVEDINGVIVTQNTIDSQYGYYNIDPLNFDYDSTVAPYQLRFDEACLLSHGLILNNATFQLNESPGYWPNMVNDTIMICASALFSDSVRAYVYSNCDSTSNLDLATGCDYWITNANDSILYQENITTNGGFMEIIFPYEAAEAPYFINFDETCLNSNGVELDAYSFEITNINAGFNEYYADSIIVCDNNPVIDSNITYSALILAGNCDSLADVFLASGCPYWVEDIYGNNVYQDVITNTAAPIILGSLNFQYDSLVAPYVLRFDENCINDKGLMFDNYNYPLNATDSLGGDIHDQVLICAHLDSNFVSDTCIDLYSNVGPWIGYYQNYTNYIRFDMGNNSNTAQSVTVKIIMPPGVTYLPWIDDFTYTVSGSVLTLNMIFPAYSSYSEILEFDVPPGILDGTLHNYGIMIANNDPSAVDCELWNNQDTLHQIVGNSYDPNAKTVSLPEKIAADTQDEFLYTIYFQNTGTAPAQDIYIIDTLSDNLDWSTFEFVRSSHVVGISDLGNGIKKFYFDGIWLPDSTTNLAESNGFVTFKVKEKENNIAGSEIFNTAYIYFDQNAPIVTNTTYNINSENLGLDKLSKINVRLFPNPATKSLQIEADNNIDKIDIYSVDGKLCWSTKLNQKEVKLDVSAFNSGLYLVRIQSQESTKTLRFVKD